VTAWYTGPEGLVYQAVTYTEWHITDDVLIQLILLMMSTGLLETCSEVKWINTLKSALKLVINKNCTEMHGQRNIKYNILVAVSIVNTRHIEIKCWTCLLSAYRHASRLKNTLFVARPSSACETENISSNFCIRSSTVENCYCTIYPLMRPTNKNLHVFRFDELCSLDLCLTVHHQCR
jgi:hypothetical protein